MLKGFWLWLGRVLGKLLSILLLVGLAGWGIGEAYYAWKFSGPVSTEEEIPKDEAALTQGIIEDAIRIVEQHRDNTRVLRDAHATLVSEALPRNSNGEDNRAQNSVARTGEIVRGPHYAQRSGYGGED